MRPKQTLKEYKKIYDETIRIQVQEVKLGDVTYHARCKVSMLEDMIQNAEEKLIYYKQRDNETLVEWFQGQIEAYKNSLEMLRSLVRTYNNL
tara:strand:+ start:1077 stop:1352 length:276 start_codon:yes stop_codon:yes gene_type:complete